MINSFLNLDHLVELIYQMIKIQIFKIYYVHIIGMNQMKIFNGERKQEAITTLAKYHQSLFDYINYVYLLL